MAGLLAQFLRASAGRPFVWGKRDCYWWVVEWIEVVRGVFATELRAKYQYETAGGCLRIVRESGGMLVVIEELVRAAGLARAEVLRRGDIVAVAHPWRGRHMLGIYLSERRIALKTKAGLAVVDRPIVCGWNL